MVRIQAQTMRPATPHLTADNLRVAPTPTIEPVIVCVVETGVPVSRDVGECQCGGSLGAETAYGFQFCDPRSHCAHNAPAT